MYNFYLKFILLLLFCVFKTPWAEHHSHSGQTIWHTLITMNTQTLDFSSLEIRNNKHEVIAPIDNYLKGKSVAFLFGSSWCPMVGQLFPQLKQFYENYKDKIEIIYISSDSEENKEYHDFINRSPWLYVPLNSPFTDKLKIHYRVWAKRESSKFTNTGILRRSGIPSLVVIDKTGKELLFMDEPIYSADVERLKSLWNFNDSALFF